MTNQPHPGLAAVIASDLDMPAKLAYSALYASTNGARSAAMPVAALMALLRIGHAGTLRGIRSRLAAAGYVYSRIDAGVLYWQLLDIDDDGTARPTAALG